MTARVTLVCGHDAPKPFMGSTFCNKCALQQNMNWENRSRAHRVPKNKATKNKKGK